MNFLTAAVEIIVDDMGLKAGLARAKTLVESSVRKLGHAFTSSITHMARQAFDKMLHYAKLAALGIVAALGASIRAYSTFEGHLANVSTMLSRQAMGIMPYYAQELKKISIEFGESTTTLSEGLYEILSASVAPSKALEVLRIASMSATAGLTDTATSVYAIVGILNAYGMAVSEAAKVSDILFAAVKTGQFSFAQLAPVIGRVTTIAASSGIPLEEIAAALSTMTRAGLSADMAVTFLRASIVALQGKTGAAVDVAREHGIELSVEALAADKLIGTVDKLRKLTQAQVAEIFTDIRSRVGLLPLLKDQTGLMNDLAMAYGSAGMTQEAFAKQSESLPFIMQRMWQAVRAAALTIGEAFAPSIKETAINVRKWLVENMDTIAVWAEKAAAYVEYVRDVFWTFVQFMQKDWQQGIRLGLNVSLELFKGFAKSLLVVLEDVFLGVGRNLSVWVKRGIAEAKEFRRLQKEFFKVTPDVGGGGMTEYAREVEQQEARDYAAKKLSTGYFQPTLEGAYPTVEIEMSATRLRKIAHETSKAIKDMLPTEVVSEFEAALCELEHELDAIQLTSREIKQPILEDFSELVERAELLEMAERAMGESAQEAATAVVDTTFDINQAYTDMYRQMGRMSQESYSNQLKILDKQKEEYEQHYMERSIIDRWYVEQKKLLDEELLSSSESVVDGIKAAAMEMKRTYESLAKSVKNSVLQMADGMAQGFAEAVVHGQKFKEAMGALLQEVAVSFLKARTSAWLDKAIPFLTDVLLGTGAANVAKIPSGTMGASGAGGVHGFQEGGIAWRPQLATLAERGPELITPLSKLESGKIDVRIHNESSEKLEISQAEQYTLSDQRIVDVTLRAMSRNGTYRHSLQQVANRS